MAAWRLTRGNFARKPRRWMSNRRPSRLAKHMMPRAGSPPIVRSSSASCCVRTKARPSARLARTFTYRLPRRARSLSVGWRDHSATGWLPLPVGSWINEDKSRQRHAQRHLPSTTCRWTKRPLESLALPRGRCAPGRFTIPLAPYLIYGDNRLSMYFNVVPRTMFHVRCC